MTAKQKVSHIRQWINSYYFDTAIDKKELEEKIYSQIVDDWQKDLDLQQKYEEEIVKKHKELRR